MKVTLKELRRSGADRLVVESVDLSLYIAHAERDGVRSLIIDGDGRPLRTRNLLDMKAQLARIDAHTRVLVQQSAYDEMVGHAHGGTENAMELPLAPGFESLPVWEH